MLAIKARYDGEKIVLPPTVLGREPSDVIVVFENGEEDSSRAGMMAAQERAFAKVWDNDEDEIYDRL